VSRARQLLGWPVRAWRDSLPFRFVVSAVVVNALLLTLTGWLLVHETVSGIMLLEGVRFGDAARVVVARAVLLAGLVFVPLSAAAMYAFALQVVRPMRAARQTAEAIAAGDLERRMPVVGPQDTAALARSLNHMAAELGARLAAQEHMAYQQHQFVSDVAHELRTPLTTVRMAADVIFEARDEFPPVTARSAELLSREVDRFEALLHDLLDLSRIDAGAAVLAAEETDLCALVRDEVAAQQPLADTYGSRLSVDSAECCLARVDPLRVRRIVMNLLTNAVEHGEGGPVEVRVRSSDEAVAIVVRDHGVGLSETDVAHVFTRFWRADPSRFRTVGGSGLGLAIALENAELHGGSLDVWGRPGQGAAFRLTLPREPGYPYAGSPLPLIPEDAPDASR